jgi:hypothetical protein
VSSVLKAEYSLSLKIFRAKLAGLIKKTSYVTITVLGQ